MNLMYVSGTYMPAAGGAEISMYTMLRQLAATDHVTVLTRGPSAAEPRFGSGVNISIRTAPDKVTASQRLLATLADEPADVVLTQNAWSDLALLTAKLADVPAVYFARSAAGTGALANADRYRCDLIISNSPAVASYVKKTWGRTSVVIPSAITPADYIVRSRTDDFITMVNPIEMKGGQIVAQLAQLLPERKFLVVRGWNHLRSGGAWDNALMRDLAEGYGDAGSWDPGDTDFSQNPNVMVLDHCDDMREVYARTRLLLVPSLRNEGRPRVAVEALCSGIPVIGSNIEGIPDTVGAAGSIVRDYLDAACWVTAIRAFDDPGTYLRASQAAHLQIARHDPVGVARRVREVLLAMLEQQRLSLPTPQ